MAALEAALADTRLSIKSMAKAAADRLGNTATIARNSYIHPEVIDLAGTDHAERRAIAEAAPDRRGLRKGECALLRLLA